MQDIFNDAQPYLSTLVLALIGLLTTVVLRVISVLQKKVLLWIDSKTSAADREVLHKIASEAFAIAEKTVTGSQTKYNTAYSYTSEMMGKAGIQVTPEEIKAAVEKAVLDYNAKTKTSA